MRNDDRKTSCFLFSFSVIIHTFSPAPSHGRLRIFSLRTMYPTGAPPLCFAACRMRARRARARLRRKQIVVRPVPMGEVRKTERKRRSRCLRESRLRRNGQPRAASAHAPRLTIKAPPRRAVRTRAESSRENVPAGRYFVAVDATGASRQSASSTYRSDERQTNLEGVGKTFRKSREARRKEVTVRRCAGRVGGKYLRDGDPGGRRVRLAEGRARHAILTASPAPM